MIKQLLVLMLVLLVGCTTTVVERTETVQPTAPVQTQNATPAPALGENISAEPKEQPIVEIDGHYTMIKKVYSYKGNLISLKGVADGICGIDVNGATYWIKEGETKHIENKLYINVKTAIVSRSFGDNDACEIIIS